MLMPTTPTIKWSIDGPLTPISVYLGTHIHALCMVSGSAKGYFPAVGLVHSLPKYFFLTFSCDTEFKFTLLNGATVPDTNYH